MQAGGGGNGVVSFRREAHVPKGGPDGGDGGRGADVVLVVDPSLRDLRTFKRKAHWKAERGAGEGSNRHGASPAALEVRVPPGAVVGDRERGISWDLTTPGQRAVVRPAARVATATRASSRRPGRRRGSPSAGCRGRRAGSTCGSSCWPTSALSAAERRQVVAARPDDECASEGGRLPFTTIEPVLGTVELNNRQLVIADIPGLIEGASLGAGLDEFLAHIERHTAARARHRAAARRRVRSGRQPPQGRGRASDARRGARRPAAPDLPVEGRPVRPSRPSRSPTSGAGA